MSDHFYKIKCCINVEPYKRLLIIDQISEKHGNTLLFGLLFEAASSKDTD